MRRQIERLRKKGAYHDLLHHLEWGNPRDLQRTLKDISVIPPDIASRILTMNVEHAVLYEIIDKTPREYHGDLLQIALTKRIEHLVSHLVKTHPFYTFENARELVRYNENKILGILFEEAEMLGGNPRESDVNYLFCRAVEGWCATKRELSPNDDDPTYRWNLEAMEQWGFTLTAVRRHWPQQIPFEAIWDCRDEESLLEIITSTYVTPTVIPYKFENHHSYDEAEANGYVALYARNLRPHPVLAASIFRRTHKNRIPSYESGLDKGVIISAMCDKEVCRDAMELKHGSLLRLACAAALRSFPWEEIFSEYCFGFLPRDIMDHLLKFPHYSDGSLPGWLRG